MLRVMELERIKDFAPSIRVAGCFGGFFRGNGFGYDAGAGAEVVRAREEGR